MEYSKPRGFYKIVAMKYIARQNYRTSIFQHAFMSGSWELKGWLNFLYDYGSSNQDNFYKKDILNTLEKFWDSTSPPLPTRFRKK